VAKPRLTVAQWTTPKSMTQAQTDSAPTNRPTGYAGVARGAAFGQPVADYFVPQAMQDALDKHAVLKQASPPPTSPY